MIALTRRALSQRHSAIQLLNRERIGDTVQWADTDERRGTHSNPAASHSKAWRVLVKGQLIISGARRPNLGYPRSHRRYRSPQKNDPIDHARTHASGSLRDNNLTDLRHRPDQRYVHSHKSPALALFDRDAYQIAWPFAMALGSRPEG